MNFVNIPTTSTQLSITTENILPKQAEVKAKGLKEREERTQRKDFGTLSTSLDDAAKRRALPGKQCSPRVRKRSIIPSKPSPPPTAHFTKTNRSKGETFYVKPYSPSLRSSVLIMSSPPMVRSSRSTVPVPTLPPRTPNTEYIDGTSDVLTRNGTNEIETKAPIPPPRRKKSTKKSPSSTRVVRLLPALPDKTGHADKTGQPEHPNKSGHPDKPGVPDKPRPPPVKQRTPKHAKPPTITPRRRSIDPEMRISGVGCEDYNGDQHTTTVTSSSIGVSSDECLVDVVRVTSEHDLQKETVLTMLPNSRDTITSCSDTTKDSDTLNNIINTTTMTSNLKTESGTTSDVQPPLPPRVRKRVKITGSPSPKSSPKFPRFRTVPQVSSANKSEDDQLRKQTSLVRTTEIEHNNDKTVKEVKTEEENVTKDDGVVSSSLHEGEGEQLPVRRLTTHFEHGVVSSPLHEGEGEQLPVRRLTTHFEHRSLLTDDIPIPKIRRNTVASRPSIKPPLPPKSVALQLRAKSKPPMPRPRSGVPVRRREEGLSPKGSPNHITEQRLGPGVKNLATSTPSLATVCDEVDTTPRTHPASSLGAEQSSPNKTQARKTGLGSPIHALAQQLRDNNQLFSDERTKSIPNILSLPNSPSRIPIGPQKPPTKRRMAKSSSVSDILDDDDFTSTIAVGNRREGGELAKQLMKELKKGVKVRQTSKNDEITNQQRNQYSLCGERLEPEGAESKPTISELHSQLPKKTKDQKKNSGSTKQQRSVSIGDISLLVGCEVNSPHSQLQIGYTGRLMSDASSYTSSEGRASVMSSENQSLIDKARQLSKNKKWCEQPEVKDSGIVPNMAKDQLLLQEAIFEIITSEATYHLNLTTLIDSFMDDPKIDPNGPESDRVLDRTQHSMIFSNVKEIRRVSTRFFEEILALFNEDIFLRNIFQILEDYARNRFLCYERYCASQGHRLKELRECTEKSELFHRELKRLEEAANQTLQSLVTAPMQRVTKLPLLMGEIFKRTPHDDPSRGQIELTHKATEEIADLCNKGAGKIGDLIDLETIWKKLHFGQLKPFLIIAPGRRLKKEGSIERLKVNRRKARVMPEKVQHYFFIFTDLFMITTEDKDRHHVVDYCLLKYVTVDPILTNQTHALETSTTSEDSYTMSGAEWTVSVAGEEHAFLVTLQESATKADSSYIFVVKTEGDKIRWMEILRERDTEVDVGGPPKGRNLTLLTRKRKRQAPTKKYWWKQLQVEKSGVVKTMTQKELELQEAIFEVVTSEEEHFAAMETLTKHYMNDTGLDPSLPVEQRVLNEEEYNDIFRYVNDVHQISEGLLSRLRARQTECIVIDTVCDIVLLCIERRFHGYIRYCTNLPNSLEQLDSSIEKNESFRGYLKQLEEDQCPLRTLLMAPMDRVCRLTEMFRNIRRKTPGGGLSYCLVETTLKALEKVEKLCTKGQEKVAKIKELYTLERKLDFGNLKPFSLVSVGRSLLKKGALTRLKIHQWFGKAVRKRTIHLIILSDCLLITKKMENSYKVVDASLLDRLQVEPVEPHAIDHNTSLTGGEDTLAGARWAVSKAGENYAFLVTLLDVRRSYTFVTSSEQERVDWMDSLSVHNDLMSFQDETDNVLTWEYFYLEAVRDYSHESDSKGAEDLDMKRGDILRVYRANNDWCEGLRVHDLHWGRFPTKYLSHVPPGWRESGGHGEGRRGTGECLVEATHDFPGEESGELQLEKGDVVKVVRQMGGWCEGKKLRGNCWGWFPSTHTKSIGTSSHFSSCLSPIPSQNSSSYCHSFTPSPSPSPSPSK